MPKKKFLLTFVFLTFLGLSLYLGTRLVQRQETFDERKQAAGLDLDIMSIKAINYFPGEHTWGRMWRNWDFSKIEEDFVHISNLNVNVIRIFLYEADLGSDFPSASKSKVDQVLAEADKYSIQVIFDFIPHTTSYPCENLSVNNEQFIQEVVNTYKQDLRVFMWELTNEPHCGDNWGNLPADARARLKQGLDFIKSFDPSHPVSVPLFQDTVDDVDDIVDSFDIFNFHIYTYSDPSAVFANAKAHAKDKPIFVGEFGCIGHEYVPDWGSDPPWHCSSVAGESQDYYENAQAEFIERYYQKAEEFGFAGFAPWIFSEFAQPEPGTGAQNTPTEADRWFGIVKLDHRWTAAATKLSEHYDLCGDGVVDIDEECDGLELQGRECSDFDFTSGALVCADDCTYDTSQCVEGFVYDIMPKNDPDGVINIYDLSLVLSNWKWQKTPRDEETDINLDGTVNIFDVSLILVHWG